MKSKHAAVGGSAIARILRCPGSVALNATLPRASSAAADRGTMLHFMAGEMILAGSRAEELIGKQHAGQTLNSLDARTALLPAVAAYRRFVGMARTPKLEVKVRLAARVWGTADIVAHRSGVGLVGDFKFGNGRVEVKSNEQMMFYAAGALNSHALPSTTNVIRMAVIQPTARPVLDEAEVTVKRVREFGREVRAVAIVALKEGAPLVPGETQCEWCPAAKADICSARRTQRATAQPNLATSLLTLSR